MTAMTAGEALKLIPITSMSKVELLALNSLIVEQIRTLQTVDAVRAGSTMKIGDIRSFYSPKYGRTVKVRIDKINVKTATCTEIGADGNPSWRTWKVATTLLQAC